VCGGPDFPRDRRRHAGGLQLHPALMEVLRHRGVSVVRSTFPFDRDPEFLSRELAKMAARFGRPVAEGSVEGAPRRRPAASPRDRSPDVGRGEGHRRGESPVARRLLRTSTRPRRLRAGGRRVPRRSGGGGPPGNDLVPIAFVGVPPIVSALHAASRRRAPVRLNEVAAAVRHAGDHGLLVEQYLA